ncbi:hypothetical protein JHK82_018809 [Glycine max]|nr:hypothetical protein JHK82_018809 [Glycine max]
MLKIGDSAKVVIKQDMKGRRHKYGFDNNKREKAQKKRVLDDETGDKHQLDEIGVMGPNERHDIWGVVLENFLKNQHWLHALAFKGRLVLNFRGLHAFAFRGLDVITFRGLHALTFRGLYILPLRGIHALTFRGLHVLTFRGLHVLVFRGLLALAFKGLHILAIKRRHVLNFRGLHALAFRGLCVLTFILLLHCASSSSSFTQPLCFFFGNKIMPGILSRLNATIYCRIREAITRQQECRHPCTEEDPGFEFAAWIMAQEFLSLFFACYSVGAAHAVSFDGSPPDEQLANSSFRLTRF